jgi:hypothetical protein
VHGTEVRDVPIGRGNFLPPPGYVIASVEHPFSLHGPPHITICKTEEAIELYCAYRQREDDQLNSRIQNHFEYILTDPSSKVTITDTTVDCTESMSSTWNLDKCPCVNCQRLAYAAKIIQYGSEAFEKLSKRWTTGLTLADLENLLKLEMEIKISIKEPIFYVMVWKPKYRISFWIHLHIHISNWTYRNMKFIFPWEWQVHFENCRDFQFLDHTHILC